MNNTYEFEFGIASLLRELLRSPIQAAATEQTTATQPQPASTASQTSSATPMDVSGIRHFNTNAYLEMMQRNQNTIEELAYAYNTQMQRYNNNIERLIQMLQTSQTRIHQYMMMHPQNNETVDPPPLYSPFRRNVVREDGNLIRSLLNTPNYNTSTLLYTYLYPYPRTQDRRNNISSEQRASAIQNIAYDTHSMQENVCPISLIPFTQGEQISQIKHCRHIFKTDSLDNWLAHYSTCCPVCRYDIRNYRETNTNTTSAQQRQNSFEYESDESDDG